MPTPFIDPLQALEAVMRPRASPPNQIPSKEGSSLAELSYGHTRITTILLALLRQILLTHCKNRRQ